MTPSARTAARSIPAAAAQGAAGVGQPGRRPSRPRFLVLVAALWIVTGVLILTGVHTSWKVIPGVVSIGIGMLFLRGAMASIARRAR